MEAAEAAPPGSQHHHHHHHSHHHHHHNQHQRHRQQQLKQELQRKQEQQQRLEQQLSRQRRSSSSTPAPGIPGLDVVRALHQTVISLRTALDSSREELRRLKEQQQQQQIDFTTTGSIECNLDEAVERLALENHVLRRRLLDRSGEFSSDAATSPPSNTTTLAKRTSSEKPLAAMEADTSEPSKEEPQEDQKPDATITEESAAASSSSAPSEAIPQQPSEDDDNSNQAAQSATAAENSEEGAANEPERPPNKLTGQGASNESENESEELDDIELIFTTEETCRDVGLQEDLVSITDNDHWQQQQQQGQQRTSTPNEPHKPLLKIGQAKSADGEPNLVCNGSSTSGGGGVGGGEKSNSVDEAASSQSSSIDREESVDRFDESSGSRLNKMWSQCSVLVETDISKCGVLEEIDHAARHTARRNTLAAPTAAYRPIIHREALAAGRRKSAGPLRPMMDRSGSGSGGAARRESGAQTDISALPAQWRSESYLAHKVAHTFTTLPSKFALPAGVSGRLRLSDKTREARRVMLSDISFTSMVPELSRSADHLCHEPHSPGHCYGSKSGALGAGCLAGLRTPESSRRESWARSGGASSTAGLPSPACECRLFADLYSARYRGSLSSIPRAPSAVELGSSRRHSWRPNASTGSFDSWRGPAVLHAGHVATAAHGAPGSGCPGVTGAHLPRPTWSSMPSSPTHVQPPSAALIARLTACPPRRTRSKVTFQECPMIRGSLPNLRSDSLADTSGDSTESLIDEAEDYLRRSIDSMLTFSATAERCAAAAGGRHSARRRRARRHSEPDLFRDWNPPQDARPYLPKIPRDLKQNHLVKVISPEGKILQGRVRYVGTVAGADDVHVGVQLPNNNGNSDGTFNGRRYFDCESERAIFVPFKKVVLAWCTT